MADGQSDTDGVDTQTSSPLSFISTPELSQSPPRAWSQDSPSVSIAQAVPEAVPPTRKPAAKKKPVPRKKARKSKWDAENILTDPKSPLATANLRSMLANPMAWAALDEQEQQEILSLFPDGEHIVNAGTPDARPNFASLANDDSFRYACAAYTENVAQGRHDPAWLASAWAAHERRKAGDFDEFIVKKFEEDWGVELPDELKTRRELLMKTTSTATETKVNGVDVSNGNVEMEETMATDDIKANGQNCGGRPQSEHGSLLQREMGDMRMDVDDAVDAEHA